jgi:hypothetical protein
VIVNAHVSGYATFCGSVMFASTSLLLDVSIFLVTVTVARLLWT